jgi:hypothetical protein
MTKDIQYPAEAAEFQEKKIPSRSLGILSKPVCISFDRGCLQYKISRSQSPDFRVCYRTR